MQSSNTCKFSFSSISFSAPLSPMKHLHKAIPWHVLEKNLMPNVVLLFHYYSDNIPNHTQTQSAQSSPCSEGLSKSLSWHDGYWIRSDQTQPTSPFDGALIANSVYNILYSELKETLQSLLLPVMAVVMVALPLKGGGCLRWQGFSPWWKKTKHFYVWSCLHAEAVTELRHLRRCT